METLPGDFTKTPFPTDVDVAVMASNLPIYNEEMIQLVVQKAHDALLPGGEFHLVGEMVDNDRCGEWGQTLICAFIVDIFCCTLYVS